MAHQNVSNRVWFITGASRGFGRVWTQAALKRGDKVAATARKLASIADFKEKYGDNVLTLELEGVDVPESQIGLLGPGQTMNEGKEDAKERTG